MPAFDSTEGLEATRPNWGAFELFLRNPTLLVTDLTNSQHAGDVIKAAAADASIPTAEVSAHPEVTELAGWADLAVTDKLLWVGVGPTRGAVQNAAAGSKPVHGLQVDARSGTNFVIHARTVPLAQALEDTVPPPPADVLAALRAMQDMTIQVQPSGNALKAWIDIHK
jgi:hypothetical protein